MHYFSFKKFFIPNFCRIFAHQNNPNTMKYSRSIIQLLIENCPRFPIKLLIVNCSLLFVSCLMQLPSEQGGTPPIAQTPVPTDASTDKQTHIYPSADNTELAGTRSDAREQIIEHTGHIVSYNNVWNEPAKRPVHPIANATATSSPTPLWRVRRLPRTTTPSRDIRAVIWLLQAI